MNVNRFECLADIFLKMNDMSLSIQGKQLTVLVANDNILAFKRKLEFWKTLLHHHKLDIIPL